MNLYAEFMKLMPQRKQFIGRVESVDAGLKMSVMTLISGGTVSVRGVGVVDALYLIESGELKQELPDFPDLVESEIP